MEEEQVWLCGLGLTKLVPEWDVQTVSPHGFPYIFLFIFLCLAFFFFTCQCSQQ